MAVESAIAAAIGQTKWREFELQLDAALRRPDSVDIQSGSQASNYERNAVRIEKGSNAFTFEIAGKRLMVSPGNRAASPAEIDSLRMTVEAKRISLVESQNDGLSHETEGMTADQARAWAAKKEPNACGWVPPAEAQAEVDTLVKAEMEWREDGQAIRDIGQFLSLLTKAVGHD